jgi:hypothetical protein
MDVNSQIAGQFPVSAAAWKGTSKSPHWLSGRNVHEKPRRIKRKRPKKAAPHDIASSFKSILKDGIFDVRSPGKDPSIR